MLHAQNSHIFQFGFFLPLVTGRNMVYEKYFFQAIPGYTMLSYSSTLMHINTSLYFAPALSPHESVQGIWGPAIRENTI